MLTKSSVNKRIIRDRSTQCREFKTCTISKLRVNQLVISRSIICLWNYTNRLQHLATSSRSRTCTRMISQPLYYSLKLYSNLCPRKFKSVVLFCCPLHVLHSRIVLDHSVGVVGLAGFAARTNTLCKALQIQLHTQRYISILTRICIWVRHIVDDTAEPDNASGYCIRDTSPSCLSGAFCGMNARQV